MLGTILGVPTKKQDALFARLRNMSGFDFAKEMKKQAAKQQSAAAAPSTNGSNGAGR